WRRAWWPGRRVLGSGREYLVEASLGLLLLGLLGERELGDQDLPGPGEHPLLAGGQTAVGVPAGEIAHDLGHLDDVPGGDLLHVRLVPAGPVGRLFGLGRTQHIAHLRDSFFAY